ncbi:cystatin-A-like [Aquarana catesbeiana]|uniref:cystatin-A-like n=1 Tax=Aquarana catesbeiana TaxID=8400 RepID=UPI003CC9E02E
MSDVVKRVIPGGYSDPRQPINDQNILDKVKEEYKKRTGPNPRKFLAVLVRIQVVNGLHYLFKVDVGDGTYSHLKLYIPSGSIEPELVGFLLNKTLDDDLEDLKHGDENDTRQ